MFGGHRIPLDAIWPIGKKNPVETSEIKDMAKDTGLAGPQHKPTQVDYEKECREVIWPLVSDIIARAEAAGWERRQAAAAVMYLAAKELDSP